MAVMIGDTRASSARRPLVVLHHCVTLCIDGDQLRDQWHMYAAICTRITSAAATEQSSSGWYAAAAQRSALLSSQRATERTPVAVNGSRAFGWFFPRRLGLAAEKLLGRGCRELRDAQYVHSMSISLRALQQNSSTFELRASRRLNQAEPSAACLETARV